MSEMGVGTSRRRGDADTPAQFFFPHSCLCYGCALLPPQGSCVTRTEPVVPLAGPSPLQPCSCGLVLCPQSPSFLSLSPGLSPGSEFLDEQDRAALGTTLVTPGSNYGTTAASDSRPRPHPRSLCRPALKDSTLEGEMRLWDPCSHVWSIWSCGPTASIGSGSLVRTKPGRCCCSLMFTESEVS